jgi:hypothetical protein
MCCKNCAGCSKLESCGEALMKIDFAKPQYVGVTDLMAVGNYETVNGPDGLGITIGSHNLGDLALWAGLGAAVGHYAFGAKGAKKIGMFAGGALAMRLLLG